MAGVILDLYISDFDSALLSNIDMLGRYSLPVGDVTTVVRRFKVSKKIVESLSRGEEPCDPHNRQEVVPCVLDYVARNMSCLLPWYQKEEFSHKPPCQSEEDFEHFALLDSKLQALDIRSLLRTTGCRRNCRYGQYEARLTLEYALPENQTSTNIRIQATRSIVTVETEVLMYDLQQFVADFGGYLGLLLGASVLTAFDKIVIILTAFPKMLLSKRGAQDKRQQHRIL